MWESPPCIELLETPDHESVSDQIWYYVQMYCMSYTIGVKADPSVTAPRHSLHLSVERSSKVDSSI